MHTGIQINNNELLESIKLTINSEIKFSQLQPWSKHLAIVSLEDNILTLSFNKSYLTDLFSSDLMVLLQEVVLNVTKNNHIGIFIDKSNRTEVPALSINPNNNLTFNNFLSGPENRLAVAAAKAVAEKPGSNYNPLFIHAPSGFGKTHILNAIHNRFMENNKTSVFHIKGEDFKRINSENKIREISDNIINSLEYVEIMIIDNVDILASSPYGEDLLFHIFDSLHNRNRQLIISAIQSPGAMQNISESLRSRLQWGLIVEIEPLERDIKRQLIINKAMTANIKLPDECLDYINNNICGSVREIDGVIRKLSGHAELAHKQIDMPIVRKTIKDYSRPQLNNITIKFIEDIVCGHFNIDHNRMVSKSRMRSIAYPRQIAMYLSQTMTNSSLEEIGKYFGGRDHSTVKHGCEKIKTLFNNDNSVRTLINDLRAGIVK